MKIITWNINSVRSRIESVTRFLAAEKPDVLCLQEIKCLEDQFPSRAFVKAGYCNFAICGQSGHHGVAIIAKDPLEEIDRISFCGKDDARHISAMTTGGIRIHNFYVPAGGDEPDPKTNEKFKHKLEFLAEMATMQKPTARSKVLLLGDLNVAPHENDVWSHKQLLKVVSHTPIETEALEKVRASGDWLDVGRAFSDDDEKLYTWWSYRARDWRASNRGRRLDHIWASKALHKQVKNSGAGAIKIHDDVRGWQKPSDHAPVSLTLI